MAGAGAGGRSFSGRLRAAPALLTDRVRRVRAGAGLAAQAGLAAGLSWWVADSLLHIAQPVFAPISAVVALAASVGQRLRRTVELIIGVAVGILIGNLLIRLVGIGAWQLGLIVTLAVVVAAFVGRSPALVVQAGATAVLIGTLTPSVPNLEVPRVVDALIGGGATLLVTAVLLPLNPLRIINRAAGPALDLLADQLDRTADALRERDAEKARVARDRLRDNKEEMGAFGEAAQGAREAAALSPLYRTAREGPLGRYAGAVEPVDRAMRNSGTLIRRAVTLLADGERVPDAMPGAVSALAEAARKLRKEFARGAAEPTRCRESALRAVAEAGRAYRAGVDFSGAVVVAQVRTTASDLLVATDVDQDEANRLVRAAFGPFDRAA
ncbi:FUSC family protein [Micromonospora sp. WMMC241]|uniref:FUSC family protein n=1 Tax=Micromonospora sp. WMMC241 TaxID=3015159 RepID=UPI0022B6D046|nr:FUSC family protein [Micromonospora sp. WMMC241]MCZ7440074.1 FUSC family protein [Micromonospora sp. WMMC241]